MKIENIAPADRSAYYEGAATWASDVTGGLRRSRRLAWIVAGCALSVAILEAGALAALAPFKTVVPYTITVDRQTGYVETAQALKPGALSQNSAVTQAFLAQYVLAREGYDPLDLQANYRKVSLWSAGDARTQYLRSMAKANPATPMKLYGTTTVLRPTIKSISMLTPTSALVRYDIERQTNGAASGALQAYTAVIGFRYTGRPMRMEDRFLNPLGFQTTAYRHDAELVGAVQ